MVAITKSILLLLGTAILCANAATSTHTPTTTTPSKPQPTVHTGEEMSQVVDCQSQCINLKPPFKHKPDINVAEYMRVKDYGKLDYLIKTIQPMVEPCHEHLFALKGNSSKLTEKLFNSYVQCDGQTLRKNNEYYAKNYDWKKNGFNAATWARFKNHTLPAFTSAVHICRGGCRRIHFAHRGPPPRPTPKPKA